ncbi:MAG: NAD-glutamate dehydrogenase [Gammaproteobacteria bacterium]|nr:NAD-glutamate dehydrogenase [Gammaproteobacteria bacterium]
MRTAAESSDEIITRVQSYLPASLERTARMQLNDFVGAYYHQLDLLDLDSLPTEDLYGAALAHWELMQQRQPGETVLRIYNPQMEHHGWQNGHTILELTSDDMPNLVATLTMVITSQELGIHLTNHPVLRVVRSSDGKLKSLYESDQAVDDEDLILTESVVHLQLDRITSEREIAELQKRVHSAINHIRFALEDDAQMHLNLSGLHDTLQQLDGSSMSYRKSIDVLEWLDDKQFSLLGTCPYRVTAEGQLEPLADQGLGILNPANADSGLHGELLLPPQVHADTIAAEVQVNKACVRSPVIRPDFLDVITLPWPQGKQEQPCLLGVVGLLSPSLKTADTQSIPLLREKTQAVLRDSEAACDSHAGRTLRQTLEQLPRDMLFQTDPATLLSIATGIVNLQERHRIRLFGTLSADGLYSNCLVYIPRETYGRELRLAIEDILLTDLDGVSSEFDSRFSSESALARIHYVVRLGSARAEAPDWSQVEAHIIEAAISWEDQLRDTLLQHYDEEQANALFKAYHSAFPVSYKSHSSARHAHSDIAYIEEHVPEDRPVIRFYHNVLARTGTAHFKLYAPGNPVALSDVIPIIENMGMRVEGEHPYHLRRQPEHDVWIHEFTVEHIDGDAIDAQGPRDNLQSAFGKIWSGEVENDGFNRLILEAGLSWRQVVILRSYCKYLLQIRVPFSQSYMIETLIGNAGIAELLVSLFEQRFNPAIGSARDTQMNESRLEINTALADVASLDQDRILRAYLNLIEATVRTNFYRTDKHGEPLDYLSYKLDSRTIKDLPLPRPAFEIFVYSPRVEGIHLRGGKVARGGLRWSDRREDFRTEVLGLMKAQMVKNAVIVPVGSKGGFFVKRPPQTGGREALMTEGVHCYQTFLRGLLDITDNYSGNDIVAPQQVVRHDADDPYLVVAADKGTATFSDYANEVAEQYGFWLGDAFASGGSVGYDHKKMGITARGAWESVKRHFRELNVDCQTTPFTTVGIGDMSGDVFGNGMLLSRETKLVAAFNHLHIFIDPDPDPETSHAERERLFALPRSGWTDYDQSLLSAGGQIYDRSAKQVELSSEAMSALGISERVMTPNELIHRLLQAPVDLLWNGGIGTYIKSAQESDAQASDRANDPVRVNAEQLRCRVIGEGGNLGVTQLGRISFARAGGRIYTDAIDNSAGVDCSDHEVNIKILVNSIVDSEDMTRKQRDELLAAMTDEVGDLVLQDNYLQTQCISIGLAEAARALEEHARFITHLETSHNLDREIEFLPGSEEIADRLANDSGLSSPELAVLVSYSKMTLYEQLLASDFTGDNWLDRFLVDYFPARLAEQFPEQISRHRLRDEIIATLVTNELVNRLGPSFSYRMSLELGSRPEEIARAYVAVREIFDMQIVWEQIESLDNAIPAAVQVSMHILVRGLVERAIHWLLRSRRGSGSIDELIRHFKPGITALRKSMPSCLASVNRKTLEERVAYFTDAGTPDETALLVAEVVPLSSALDIVEISQTQDKPVEIVAAVYFELGVNLELQWLRDEIGSLAVRTHWHTLAKSELRNDMHYQQRHLCAEVLSTVEGEDPVSMVTQWATGSQSGVEKYRALINDMKGSSAVDFAMLSLAVNEVHKLLRSDRPLAS